MEWTDGMLYPVLHRLERLGHVEARWEVAETGRRRKYYRITPGGAPSSSRTAGSGRRWTRRCGASGRPCRCAADRLVAIRNAASRGGLIHDHAGNQRRTRRPDQPVAHVPAAPAGDPLRGCGRARGSPARADRGPRRFRSRRRRGVPRRGQAHGQPRRAFARVRARTLRTTVEAARGGAGGGRRRPDGARREAFVAFGLAVAAAVAIKAPALFGLRWGEAPGVLSHQPLALFVLPLLVGYFAWKRQMSSPCLRLLAWARRSTLAVFANLYQSSGANGGQGVGCDRGPLRYSTCPSRCGCWAVSPMRAAAGARARAHGLHPLLGRALHLLRADRPRAAACSPASWC
jgi:hypothetical protein